MKGIQFKKEIEGLNEGSVKKYKRPTTRAVVENEYGISSKKPELNGSLIDTVSDMDDDSSEEEEIVPALKGRILLDDIAINKNKDSFLRRKTKEINIEEQLFIHKVINTSNQILTM